MIRSASVCAAAALFGFAFPTNAAPPTRIPFEFDDTFQSGFLSRACGIPVYAHIQGSAVSTFFYDPTGTKIIREIDTFAAGTTATYFSPATGKSLTQTTHTPVTYLYPEGAAIDAPVIAITNGVQFTSGPGNPRVVGHEISEGAVVDLSPQGFPIVELFDAISQSGQFDVSAVVQARCAILTDP